MADKKISQLPPKGTPMGAYDLIEVSEAGFIPGAFISKKMRRDKLAETVISIIPSASFYDNTTQATTALNIVPMEISQVGFLNNISLYGTTGMQVNDAGYYNVQFSAQIYRTSGGTSQHVDIFLRNSGTDIANSNTKVSVHANSVFLVAAWNWFVYLAAGEYIEIMWSPSASTIQLKAEVEDLSLPCPATPSVIATINRIG